MGGLPTEDKAPFQQMTFTLHDSQAEQVKRAIAMAGKMGDFTDSPNQNSNGNGLAFICETFVTDYANR
jgi:ParB family chromosome partitioning protein